MTTMTHIKETTDYPTYTLESIHTVTHGDGEDQHIVGYYYTATDAIQAASALTSQTRICHVARVENTIIRK